MVFKGERGPRGDHYSDGGGHLERSRFNAALRQAEPLGLSKGNLFFAKRGMRRITRDGKK